jgi:VCBS repeat-containing protein
MQQQQHEEWISKHTWGATAMDQDEQIDQAQDEDDQPAGETEGFLEDEEPFNKTTAPPTPPRIVEGTLVESTLLVHPMPPSLAPGAENDQSPTHSLRRWVQQGIVTVLVALFTVLGLVPTQAAAMHLFVSLVPAAGASATVTLVTDQVDLRRTYTLLAIPAGVTVPTISLQHAQPQAQVEARLLTAPILTQAVTVPTTGKGHQPPMQAHGLVTFYNQAPTAQAIPAGMALSGSDGVQVVTDQAVVVPAAHLPTQGQVSVSAHAVQAGPQGNIGANDLNGPCCLIGIAVQNRQTFAGGANARDYQAVGGRDVSGAATPLTTTLSSQGQAAVQAQVHPNEQLVHPVQCPSQVTALPAVGEEATQVTVTVRVACHAEVYNADEMQARVTTLLNQEASARLGSAYVLQGEETPTVSAMTTYDAQQGVVSLQVQAEGVWAYQLSAAQLHALTALVAGKLLQEARTILLHTQGIHQVTISSTDWWDNASQQTLPQDPNRIQTVVMSWAGV